MFELLAGIDILPAPEEAIVQVHSGMNKLRVSVGNFVSEPSEVYIITSVDDALMRSFIVFYVVEPGTHVIYGYAGNPYDPVFRGEVLQEAVDFLEEMGAILEEINWEEMSPEERRDWVRNETLYPLPDENGAEELADLEEIEPEELLEIVEEEDSSNEDVDMQPETIVPETPAEEPVLVEPVEPEGDEGTGTEEAGEEDADYRDFDNLLKQAFLKPDLVKKSRVKTGKGLKDEPPEDEKMKLDRESLEAGEDGFEIQEEAMEVAEEEDSEPSPPGYGKEEPGFEVAEEDLQSYEDDEQLSALIKEVSSEASSGITGGELQGDPKQMAADPGDRTRLTVIRYLSRF